MSSLSHTSHATLHSKGHSDESDISPGDIAVGVIIGRASEYFDFFVFGIACALIFPSVFFPFVDPLQGTLYSFLIFSFAFIARPFGTALFMSVQRRWGRSGKLTIALFLLGTATSGIAFLPSYQQLGATTIGLLVAFRIAQGVALGGSWDGLPSLLALNAPPNRRGWYSMLGQLGAPLGFVMAAGLFAYLYSQLNEEDLYSWGWRYPFFVAFAINVVALFARLRLVVDEQFDKQLTNRELEPTPVLELLGAQGKNVLVGAFATLASFALFHIVTIFPLSWIKIFSAESITSFLTVQIVGAVLASFSIVASGLIADRFGRAFTLGALAALIGVFSLFTPMMLDGALLGKNTFILLGFVLLGLSYGQSAGAITSTFESKYRYTGAALTADFGWLIGAAFAPLVALGLSSRFGLVAVSVYLLSGAVCTILALRYANRIEPDLARMKRR